MKILYVFPHPDDESYGPAGAIYQQLQAGHEVHLLTLTEGEATRMRHKLGLSKAEMGQVRRKEMEAVAQVLGLSSLTVWTWPDSQLQDLDPRPLVQELKAFIQQLKPEILVSYPVHGISGFHDHLVTHSLIKQCFLELKTEGHSPIKRLAFYTIPDHGQATFSGDFIRMRHTTKERIDCIEPLSAQAIQKNREALMAYESYQEVIEESGILNKLDEKAHYEFFQENFEPPVQELTAGL